MKRVVSLFAPLLLCGCIDEARAPLTFSCVSMGEENAAPGREVLFHFAEGYLFLQNDLGGAENVCTQVGTTECTVKMTAKELTLNQMVENPSCDFRSVARTTLEINKTSGAFRLLQEGCDPADDLVITGICQSIEDQPK